MAVALVVALLMIAFVIWTLSLWYRVSPSTIDDTRSLVFLLQAILAIIFFPIAFVGCLIVFPRLWRRRSEIKRAEKASAQERANTDPIGSWLAQKPNSDG